MHKKLTLILLASFISLPINAVIQSITQLMLPSKKEIFVVGSLNNNAASELLTRDANFLKHVLKNWAQESKQTALVVQPNLGIRLNILMQQSPISSSLYQAHTHLESDLETHGLPGTVTQIHPSIMPQKTHMLCTALTYFNNFLNENVYLDDMVVLEKELTDLYKALSPDYGKIAYSALLEEFASIINELLQCRKNYPVKSVPFIILNTYFTQAEESILSIKSILEAPQKAENPSLLDVIINSLKAGLENNNGTIKQLKNSANFLLYIFNVGLLECSFFNNYYNYSRTIVLAEQACALQVIAAIQLSFDAAIEYHAGTFEMPTAATSLFDENKLQEIHTKIAPFAAYLKCSNPQCTPVNKKTSQCSGCKKVAYCSKECQKAHWKQHRLICTK